MWYQCGNFKKTVEKAGTPAKINLQEQELYGTNHSSTGIYPWSDPVGTAKDVKDARKILSSYDK